MQQCFWDVAPSCILYGKAIADAVLPLQVPFALLLQRIAPATPHAMSLIASSLKGKAVQRISCSLCNAGPAGYRALSSSSSRAAESDISPAERQRRRELANRILQEEALENQRQAGSASGSNLQSGLSELTSTFRGIASEGIRAGSIAQRTRKFSRLGSV